MLFLKPDAKKKKKRKEKKERDLNVRTRVKFKRIYIESSKHNWAEMLVFE